MTRLPGVTADQIEAISARNRASRRKDVAVDTMTAEPPAATRHGKPGNAGMGKKARKPTAKPKIRETDVLKACLELLAVHPKVHRAWRANAGSMQIDGRHVRFGIKGQADITGILKGGRRLEVEVKRPGKLPTDDQYAFLVMINACHGFGCWVDSVDKLELVLRCA